MIQPFHNLKNIIIYTFNSGYCFVHIYGFIWKKRGAMLKKIKGTISIKKKLRFNLTISKTKDYEYRRFFLLWLVQIFWVALSLFYHFQKRRNAPELQCLTYTDHCVDRISCNSFPIFFTANSFLKFAYNKLNYHVHVHVVVPFPTFLEAFKKLKWKYGNGQWN